MKYLSVREAQELDRRAQQEFHIPAILLMEHAAQAVAAEALSLGKRFVVVVGPGNNGGDGLAAARLLHLQGKRVDLLTLRPLDPENVQTRMVRALGVPQTRDLRAPVIIDALFGAGLVHVPSDPVRPEQPHQVVFQRQE